MLGWDMLFEAVFILIATIGRTLVGAILLLAGVVKLKTGAQLFSQAILGYRLVPPAFATLLGRILPWIEVITGICLIFGLVSMVANLLAFTLLLTFSTAMTFSLYRGHKHDCGCFGLARKKQLRWQMVYRNLALMGILVVSALCGRMSVIDLPISPSLIRLNSLLGPAILSLVWILNLCSVLAINLLVRRRDERPRVA